MKRTMKRIVIILAFALMSLCFSGCLSIVCPIIGAEVGWSDISTVSIPDDPEFIAAIEVLFKPWLIAAYMQTQFEYRLSGCAKSPYLLWKTKKGDCNDFSLFGTFVANYNGIEAWQVRIVFDDSYITHWLGVYWEESIGLYSYTSNQFFSYYVLPNFEAVVENYCYRYNREWASYKIYDKSMNIVGEKTKE